MLPRTLFERHSSNDLAGKLLSLTSSQITALVTRVGSRRVRHKQPTKVRLCAKSQCCSRELWAYRHVKSACTVAAAEPLNGTTLVPGHKRTLQLESSTAREEADEDMQAPHQPALLVFSGGTAFNSVAGDRCCHCPNKAQAMHIAVAMNKHNASHMTVRCFVAGSLRNFTTRVAHVLPVSDDGGSTAEIVRVLGGPAVGDIRSRCLRLADDSNTEVTVASPCKMVLCTIPKRLCPECLRLSQRSGGLASWTCLCILSMSPRQVDMLDTAHG